MSFQWWAFQDTKRNLLSKTCPHWLNNCSNEPTNRRMINYVFHVLTIKIYNSAVLCNGNFVCSQEILQLWFNGKHWLIEKCSQHKLCYSFWDWHSTVLPLSIFYHNSDVQITTLTARNICCTKSGQPDCDQSAHNLIKWCMMERRTGPIRPWLSKIHPGICFYASSHNIHELYK